MDGAVFADDIVVADSDKARDVFVEGEVLGLMADYRADVDFIILPDFRVTGYEGIGMDFRSSADGDVSANDYVGPDIDRGIYVCAWINNRCGIDSHEELPDVFLPHFKRFSRRLQE